MAGKTYAQINREIAKLQAEADKVRQQEVAGVLEKIRSTVQEYGIKPEDIYGRHAVAPTTKRIKAKVNKKPMFADGNGNTWVGRGPRPLWLREQLEAGKSLEDFKV